MPNAQLSPIEPADLFKLKFVASAALSPNGKQIAYVVTHVDDAADKEFGTIWLMDAESGASRQLTSGTSMDAAPKWSPDGTRIAFMSTRNERPQLFVIPVDGGEALQLTKLKQGVGSGPSWSPDGQHIAFTTVPKEEMRDFSKPYRVDRAVYRFNAMEYLDDVVQSLYIVPTAGGDVRRLTHDRCMSAAPKWSPDGKTILFLANMFPDKLETFLPSIRLVNLIDNNIEDLTGKWGEVYEADWLPDGKSIVFVGQQKGKTIGSKNDVWVMPAAGGTPECRTAGLKYGVGGGLEPDMPAFGITDTFPISSDGSMAYMPVQIGGTVQIYSIALSGAENTQCVVGGDRTCMLMGANDKQILYIISSMSNPTELFIADISGANERQLTHLNDEFLSQRQQSKVEHLLFPGSDGAQVEGWLAMPATGQAPFPTILLIHGGPHGAFGHMYHFDTEMLVGAGYAVLRVNHRASTGYGDEFSTAINKDWGNLDYKDLMAGVDYVISKGWADPDRLGITGLSGGGNLTCWTIGQTNRFKAAMPQNPVTNWVSFYGVSDIGVWFATAQLGGHPWEVPEIYAKCSPITYAQNCKTPTLLVQSEHDWRCPPEQSEQFYTVLKVNGCIAEMVRVPDAPHAAAINGALPARRIHNEVLLDWMNRYVLGKGDKKSA